MKKARLKIMLATILLSGICSLTSFAGWEQMGDGSWTYYTEDGSTVTNQWIQSGSDWYYLNNEGTMAVNTLIEDNGNTYYVADSGIMAANQWVHYNDKYYYADSTGAFFKGAITPDGYILNDDGSWAQETTTQARNTPQGSSPTFSTYMSSEWEAKCETIIMIFTNNSPSNLIIYGKNSFTRDKEYPSFERYTSLRYTKDDGNTFIPADSVEVLPGEEVGLMFDIIGTPTFYDIATEVVFAIEYEGNGYMCINSNKNGCECISFEELSQFSDTPILLDDYR